MKLNKILTLLLIYTYICTFMHTRAKKQSTMLSHNNDLIIKKKKKLVSTVVLKYTGTDRILQ